MAKHKDFPPVETQAVETQGEPMQPARPLSRFRVKVRHCPIPKPLKDMEIEAASEADAWNVYLAAVKARLSGSEVKSDKEVLKLLDADMVDGHRIVTRV